MATARSSLRLAISAMATRFELVIIEDGRGEAALRAIGEAALAAIVECDAALSRFRRDGLIALIEREAFLKPVRLDDATFELFAECLCVQVASEGRFDITVGEAMERWGLHETVAGGGGSDNDLRSDEAGAPSPGPTFMLDTGSRAIRLVRPGVRFDLGGIAKGHAIDLAVAVLREHAITNALIHGGTSAIAAVGSPPDEDGWAVAIAGSGHTIVLRNQAMCVSAPHGRTIDGRHHIIDPHTGMPATTAALAAVIGPSARTCDAWTKPALIEGDEPRRLPGGYKCLVRSRD